MAEEVRALTVGVMKRGGSRKHPDGCQCGKCPKIGRPRGSRNRTKAEIERTRGDGVHRLLWKPSNRAVLQRGGYRPGAGRKPDYLKLHLNPIIPPWRLPACLSRAELLRLLDQARLSCMRDWLMILIAAWHGLSPVELVGLTKDSILGGGLTIQKLKSHKTVVQPLVRHEDPLLDERKALLDFVEHIPPGQRVFNVHVKTFYRCVHKHALAAGIPLRKANPRTLKHSMAIQSLGPENVPSKSIEIKGVAVKRKRGRQQGELLGDTVPRITMTAYLKLQNWKKRRIARELFPTLSSDTAWDRAKHNIFKRHAEPIKREMSRLVGLPHSGLEVFQAARDRVYGLQISRESW